MLVEVLPKILLGYEWKSGGPNTLEHLQDVFLRDTRQLAEASPHWREMPGNRCLLLPAASSFPQFPGQSG